MSKAAEFGDWKTEAMPPAHAPIALDRVFLPAEMVAIRLGVIPEEMEDKWFVYWLDDTLHFHRSWTGFCIYAVRFAAEGDCHRMVAADVNRAPDQYSETDDGRDAEMISYLIDTLLLGRFVEYPSHESDPGTQALAAWSQVGRAMFGRVSGEPPEGLSAGTASRMSVVEGDITRLQVDAIVNAANTSLLGGGGVDGAIHAAAGSGLLEECRRMGGCPTGEARITGGHALPARFVVHTVGPVYRGGGSGEPDLLRACYRNSLALAAEAGASSVAFPCISTGVYGYPAAEACEIAVATVAEWLDTSPLPRSVVFCCFDPEDARVYADRLCEGRRAGL